MKLHQYRPIKRSKMGSGGNDVAGRMDEASRAMNDLLQGLKPSELALTDGEQKYLGGLLHNAEYTLPRDAMLVGSAIAETGKSIDDIVFVEYGGGVGVHSLLAKALGVRTVIYNDLLPWMCRIAREVALALDFEADHYVQGDIDALVGFCEGHGIKADAVTSNDVVEHIYDIEDFCSKLHLVSHEGTVMMHATDANMLYYPAARRLPARQRAFEAGYFRERMRIIREYSPDLGGDEIEVLALRTRGLWERDIWKAVDWYNESGQLPEPIEHPSNTCNPENGWWQEHLMNPYYVSETLQFNGFEAEVLPGYWDTQASAVQIKRMLNVVIGKASPHLGLHLCYYLVIGAKYAGSFPQGNHRQHKYRCARSPVWYLAMLAYEPLSLLLPSIRRTRDMDLPVVAVKSK